jgi:hypothetical protein
MGNNPASVSQPADQESYLANITVTQDGKASKLVPESAVDAVEQLRMFLSAS